MSAPKPYRGYKIHQSSFRGRLYFFVAKDGKEVARAAYLHELKAKIDQLCEARHERA